MSGLQISGSDKLWQVVIENNQFKIEESADSQTSPIDPSIFGNFRASFSDYLLQLFHSSEKAPISQLNLESLLGETKEKSLCWLNQYTIVLCFSNQEQLVVSPVSLLNESKSSNGTILPMISWSESQLFVHRASLFKYWFKLQRNEIWDVIDSQVGSIADVEASLDGKQLAVLSSSGIIGICDFKKRIWRIVPLQSALKAKFLGSSFLIVLSKEGLFLVATDLTELKPSLIPLQGSISDVRFVDTFGGDQMIIQMGEAVHVFRFNINAESKQIHFTVVLSLAFTQLLLQSALLSDGNLLLLTADYQLLVLKGQELHRLSSDCLQFLVLAAEFILLKKKPDRVWSLNWKGREYPLKSTFNALYPHLTGIVLLQQSEDKFSLNASAPETSFLLPELFFLTRQQRLLDEFGKEKNDLLPLCLEYLILKCTNEPELLRILDEYYHEHASIEFAKALTNVARKIEVHEASGLLAHMFHFAPLKIIQKLLEADEVEASLVFIPYLAKSYHEDISGRKQAITLVLSRLRQVNHPKLDAILEFLKELQLENELKE